MKFSIAKNELEKALTIAKLNGTDKIKIIAELNKIDMISVNTTKNINGKDYSIYQQIDADVTENGTVVLNPDYLSAIVKRADETIQLEKDIDNNVVKITTGKSKYKLNGFDENYFNPTFKLDAKTYELDVETLKDLLNKTKYAVSTKPTRPILTGVNFDYKPNKLTAIATDSYRLALKTIDVDLGPDAFNITLPYETIKAIETAILNDSEKISIACTSNSVIFSSENVIVKSPLLAGPYPETRRLIPTTFNYIIEADRKALINALERTLFIKNDNMTIVTIDLNDNEMVLKNKSPEIGESKESIPVKDIQKESETFTIAFDASYMINALKVISNDSIKINFTEKQRPFTITTDNPNEINLMLPVRLYN